MSAVRSAPSALNTDKEINTQWYNVGFSYNFNRDWGVMVRIPTVNRTLTTDTDRFFPGQIQSFNSKDIGDIEIMGMYTGFFKDMSTGLIFGVKLPTGTYNAPGSTATPRSGRAAPTSCSAASIAAC